MKDYKLPYSIQNKYGEKLTFLKIISENGKEILLVENEVNRGCGPVMHVHFKQEESLTVTEGKIGYQILGGEEKFAGVGETVAFKSGVYHRFWNAGDSILRCSGTISPANNIIYYLENIYRLMDEGNGQPGGFDAAYLITKYKSEFDVIAIPSFVKKVIFPVSIFFGKLSGKHKKFEEAPPAV